MEWEKRSSARTLEKINRQLQAEDATNSQSADRIAADKNTVARLEKEAQALREEQSRLRQTLGAKTAELSLRRTLAAGAKESEVKERQNRYRGYIGRTVGTHGKRGSSA